MKRRRRPAFAGYFYPKGKAELSMTIERLTDSGLRQQQAKAVISPHAGYIYSGSTAGAVFSRTEIPNTVILLGPNHTGYGEPYAVEASGIWSTPLGDTEIDSSLAEALLQESRYLQEDIIAFSGEHSLEVQLPFLQFFKSDVRILPILLSGTVDDPAWNEIGDSIAKVVSKRGGADEILLVASSDMTHHEEESSAEEKDNYAIEAILAMDEESLIQRIFEKDISMCGYGPIIASIIAAKALGAETSELIRYQTSAAVSKDYSQVVGYAGIIFT